MLTGFALVAACSAPNGAQRAERQRRKSGDVGNSLTNNGATETGAARSDPRHVLRACEHGANRRLGTQYTARLAHWLMPAAQPASANLGEAVAEPNRSRTRGTTEPEYSRHTFGDEGPIMPRSDARFVRP